jgi:hypothetical protein
VLSKPEKRSIEMTERIDRVVLNRYSWHADLCCGHVSPVQADL